MSVDVARVPVTARLADYAELGKARITTMVVITAAVGFLVAGGAELASLHFLNALVGTGLLAAGAATLNQLLEREFDAQMRRTADRPLPSGRIRPDQALRFGVLAVVSGLVVLLLGTNALTAALGAITVASYVFVYTPLKRVTSLATLVGAIPGALPPVMGWAAARHEIGAGAVALFGILFLWQLPHFLAIAWLYRLDYEAGGFPMLPVRDPSGERTSLLMILYAVAILPVSLVPALLGLAGGVYFAVAAVTGIAFLASCFHFAHTRSGKVARQVVLASVFYLPVVLLAMVLDRVAG